ncbi:MAG: Trm112 family protein [Legionellales bacterium]|nr:Trm112 family protein [Legionellales bacterium]
MDKQLLAILVCPQCKGKLQYESKQKELICRFDRLAFPVRDEIPIMLIDEARHVTTEELER